MTEDYGKITCTVTMFVRLRMDFSLSEFEYDRMEVYKAIIRTSELMDYIFIAKKTDQIA